MPQTDSILNYGQIHRKYLHQIALIDRGELLEEHFISLIHWIMDIFDEPENMDDV